MRNFRIRDAWRAGYGTARANLGIVLPCLAIAVAAPLVIFSLFSQSSFRHFYVVFSGMDGVYTSSGTIRTIISMFLIALWTIWTALFAGWSALLSKSRDGWITETLMGAVAALATLLAFAIVAFIGVQILAVIIGFLSNFFIGAHVGLGAIILPAIVSLVALFGPQLWLQSRLVATGPVMAANNSLNPFFAMVASWRLTRPVQWRMLAYLGLFQLLWFLLYAVGLAASIKLVYAAIEGWPNYAITGIWMAYNAIMFLIFLIVPLGIYQAASTSVDLDVFE